MVKLGSGDRDINFTKHSQFFLRRRWFSVKYLKGTVFLGFGIDIAELGGC
jgi:hypothetical protein